MYKYNTNGRLQLRIPKVLKNKKPFFKELQEILFKCPPPPPPPQEIYILSYTVTQ